MTTTRHEIESSKLARLVADIEAVELLASDCRRLPLVEILPSGRIEIIDGYHRIAGMIAAGETSIPCLTCDDEDLVAAAANAEDTVAQAEALAAIYGDNEKIEAYNTGYESYVQGESLISNAYVIGTLEFDQWTAGWLAAQDAIK